MKTKFTKGKWFTDKFKPFIVKDINNNQVAYCYTENNNIDEDVANAKLIASAPEMFEMLEKTFNWLAKTQGNSIILEDINQLLTKITEL